MQAANLRNGVVLLTVCATIAIAGISVSSVVQPPDSITIDTLSGRYGPVLFDHALHDSYASCVECHHHVTSDPPSDPRCLGCHEEGKALEKVGCRECHPADRYARTEAGEGHPEPVYHDDVPGLIGAYHLNCISCHQGIGAGPTGCEECHVKNQ